MDAVVQVHCVVYDEISPFWGIGQLRTSEYGSWLATDESDYIFGESDSVPIWIRANVGFL